MVAVAGRDQRPHLGVRRCRVADLHALDGWLEQLHEPVEHRRLHQNPRPGAAVLPGVVEHRVRRGRRRFLKVSVGEHDVGALAAKLQRQPLDLPRAAGHDLLADLGRAGEHDLARRRGGRPAAARPPSPCPAAPGTRLRAGRPPARARRPGSRSAGSSRPAWLRRRCPQPGPGPAPRTGSASGSSTARSGPTTPSGSWNVTSSPPATGICLPISRSGAAE